MYVEHPLVKKGKIRLRDYQETIVATAVGGNTLVVLPTGLGKTIIALMVSVHRLKTFPDKKILFFAPTKPLVEQHKKTFEGSLVDLPMTLLTGTVPVKKRKDIYRENQLIFATPQTVGNDIMRGLSLTDVSLVIFDEAHRAVKNYSYVEIANEYMKKVKNPLILALTASPGSSKEKVDEICGNLFIQNVEAKTERDSDVRPYVQEVKTEWVRVDLPVEFKKLKEVLEDVMRGSLRQLKAMGYLESAEIRKINKRTLLAVQSEIRTEITDGSDSYGSASTVAFAIKVNHALELLETQGISALDAYFRRMSKQRTKAVKNIMADPRVRRVLRMIRELSAAGLDHPKLDEVVKIVKQYKGGKILIFNHYRDSVVKVIGRLRENGILAHEFVGQAHKDSGKGMTQKKQIQILNDFRQGKYTALVSTSVGEEGIDIPNVDVVIFYEPIPSEIRSIQRRGRTGRTTAGKVFVLMARGTRDEGYYWASYHKEKKMRAVVKKMSKESRDIGQQSLLQFGAGESSGVTIFVDVREQRTSIVKKLKEKANVELRQLPVGDFILSDRVAVERKTVDDFLQSMVDKRLFDQASELTRNFEIPLLILEGSKDIFSQRNIHPNAIRGALVSLPLDFGISIIQTKNEGETAEILFAIAKREQIEANRTVALRGERKPLTLHERQRFIIESLPFVSAVLARRLLEKFGSVQAIVGAGEKELMEVEGIGKKKAKDIRKVVKSTYVGD